MRNFARINNWYNLQAARSAWQKMAALALERGVSELTILEIEPPAKAGVVRIDRAIARLRGEIEARRKRDLVTASLFHRTGDEK